MSKLQGLKAASSMNDVAALLGFKPSSLAYLLYRRAPESNYQAFQIPKRFGGARTISAPVAGLKVAQEKLSNLLQDCEEEMNIAGGRKNQISHGFKRRRSIITNAKRHRNRRYVFNVDLKDFFPSLNFGRVRGYFMKYKGLALDEKVATVIAQIACYQNALPQGSPCSPVISNLIAHTLDIYCVELASKTGCIYSRYADDLSFSTNKRLFPEEIAVQSAANPHEWAPGSELLKAVKRGGFQINNAKTRMQYRNSRQEVTGLIVNRRINVRNEYRHTVRAMVHNLLKHGTFEHYAPIKDAAGAVTMEPRPGTLNQLNGMLSFIGRVDLYNRRRAEEAGEKPAEDKKEVVYRKFLLYRDFYASETPVVICEGETDNVYLVHAIRSQAANFPELATVGADGKITLRVRLYKHSGSNTARIVDLGDGGSASLTKFLATYHREVGKFQAPGAKHPVIILYDNDSGARKLKGVIAKLSLENVTGNEPYVRIMRNLYAVPTPLVGGAAISKIEDFFDPAIKATVLNGKTFSDGNEFEADKYYGKKVFAHKVVRPQAETINFGGFSQILDAIVAVLKHHATTNAAPAGA
jgi:retron-type reverse transcriptase